MKLVQVDAHVSILERFNPDHEAASWDTEGPSFPHSHKYSWILIRADLSSVGICYHGNPENRALKKLFEPKTQMFSELS